MKLKHSFKPLKSKRTRVIQTLRINDYDYEIGNVLFIEKYNKLQRKKIQILQEKTTPLYGDYKRELYKEIQKYTGVIVNGII